MSARVFLGRVLARAAQEKPRKKRMTPIVNCMLSREVVFVKIFNVAGEERDGLLSSDEGRIGLLLEVKGWVYLEEQRKVKSGQEEEGKAQPRTL